MFVGGLLGAMLVFLFSSLAIRAVGKAAGDIIEEVRRQFREDPGIMAGTSRPDYARAVDITAQGRAARDGRCPASWPSACPIVVGLVFRYCFASHDGGNENSGWLAVAGLLMVGTIAGILLATVLNNGGGAWDNAKKFIESGGLKDENGNVLGKGTDDPRRGRRRRHRRRPVQGHRRPVAARADQAAEHDHAGAGAAVHRVSGFGCVVCDKRQGLTLPLLLFRRPFRYSLSLCMPIHTPRAFSFARGLFGRARRLTYRE